MVSNARSIGSRKIIICNSCNGKTNHELKAVYTTHYIGDDSSQWLDNDYRIWACLGCNNAVFEDIVIQSSGENLESTFYPNRNDGQIPIKIFLKLDRKLNRVYQEVVNSYNIGLKITCAMGLRALLEGICVNKGIVDEKAYGLKEKLKKLEEYHILPSNIAKSLYSFKFIGDDAAHRLDAPAQEELKLAIDVMEDLLNFLYDMEYKLASKAQKLSDIRFKK